MTSTNDKVIALSKKPGNRTCFFTNEPVRASLAPSNTARARAPRHPSLFARLLPQNANHAVISFEGPLAPLGVFCHQSVVNPLREMCDAEGLVGVKVKGVSMQNFSEAELALLEVRAAALLAPPTTQPPPPKHTHHRLRRHALLSTPPPYTLTPHPTGARQQEGAGRVVGAL